MTLKSIVVFAAVLLAVACDGRRGMAVRTYELHRLDYSEAETLVTPYVGEGGFISGKGRLLTVRESPDRLDSIAALLKRYDGVPVLVTLRFQVIEAGDFDGGDSAIARVEAPLREMFRYRGYRLQTELMVTALEGVPFRHQQGVVRVSGTVRAGTAAGAQAGLTIEVEFESGGDSLNTIINGVPGKTVVMGLQRRSGGGGLILAVHPTLGANAPQP